MDKFQLKDLIKSLKPSTTQDEGINNIMSVLHCALRNSNVTSLADVLPPVSPQEYPTKYETPS